MPEAVDPIDLMRSIEDHRLAGLVQAAGVPREWPASVREFVRKEARAQAVLELVQRRELHRIVSVLADGGVEAALFKGAALAYSVYREPWLRPREDTDLLVDEAGVERAVAVLTAIGYAEAFDAPGRVSTHQRHFERREGTVRHACDLHWRLLNPHAFARRIRTDRLLARCVPLLVLHPAARTLSPADSLLAAAMHRVAHHDGRDLLWLYDIHLIAGTTEAVTLASAIDLAESTAMCAVLADALSNAAALFRTPLPPAAVAWCAASRNTGEASEAFVTGNLRAVDVLWSDLRAIPDWSTRATLLRERLFPPDSFVRARAGGSRLPLPLLYGLRLWHGVPKWIGRPRAR